MTLRSVPLVCRISVDMAPEGPHPQRSQRRRLRAGRAGDGLVLLPGKPTAVSLSGKGTVPRSCHRSGKEKPSKSCAWHRKTHARPTCSCRSDGRVGRRPSLSLSWQQSLRTNQPRKAPPTGITGSREDTFSEPAAVAQPYRKDTQSLVLDRAHGFYDVRQVVSCVFLCVVSRVVRCSAQ
jgi:hypothetical protein